MNTKTTTFLTLIALLIGGVTAQTQSTGPELNAVMINTDPVPVQSGEDAEITFRVYNSGGETAQGLEVSVVDSFPFDLKPDRTRSYSIGHLASGESIQLPTAEVLVSEDAPDGRNEFKVRIETENGVHTKTFPVQVQSQDIKVDLANLKTTPTQLMPDMENAKMTVETVNNGEKTAENVVVKTRLPESFEQTSSFSTRQSLGNLPPGQVKPATFTFDVEESAEKGTVEIPTNITYTTGDSDTRIREETEFSFHLSGRPQFEITNVESDLSTGRSGEIELTVTNTGQEQASSTRVRVIDSSDQPFSYDSGNQYVGTLEPGQNGTVIFDVTADQEATAKDHLIDFEIRGVKDTQTYVEDTTAEITVNEGQERDSDFSLIPIAVAIAVAVGLLLSRKKIMNLIRD